MTELHDVRVAGSCPLFDVDIAGITIPMRRVGWTEDGDPYLEVAETVDGFRDVLPQDKAVVTGAGHMVAVIDVMDDETGTWSQQKKAVGTITGARLQVGKSLEVTVSDD
jgi:hypothetical protein